MDPFLQGMVKKDHKTDKDDAQPYLSERETSHFIDHLKADQVGGFELVIGRPKVYIEKRVDHGVFAHRKICNRLRPGKSVAGGRGKIITSPDADKNEEAEDQQIRNFVRKDPERFQGKRPADSGKTFLSDPAPCRDI